MFHETTLGLTLSVIRSDKVARVVQVSPGAPRFGQTQCNRVWDLKAMPCPDVLKQVSPNMEAYLGRNLLLFSSASGISCCQSILKLTGASIKDKSAGRYARAKHGWG